MCETNRKKITVNVTPRVISSITRTMFSTYVHLSEVDIVLEDRVKKSPDRYLSCSNDAVVVAGSTCYEIRAIEHQLDKDGITVRSIVDIEAIVDSNMSVLDLEHWLGELSFVNTPDHLYGKAKIEQDMQFADSYGWFYNQSSALLKKYLINKYSKNKQLMGKLLKDIYSYKVALSKSNATVPYSYYPVENTIGGVTHKEFTLFIDGEVEHKLLAFLDTIVNMISSIE